MSNGPPQGGPISFVRAGPLLVGYCAVQPPSLEIGAPVI
jgi:hypothetical protein